MSILALAFLVFGSGCATEKQVRAAVADSNAAAVDLAWQRESLGVDGIDPKVFETALDELEVASALPDLSATAVASLRMRQALLCLAANKPQLAAAYHERVVAGDLPAREAKLHQAWTPITWWLDKASGGIGNSDAGTARNHVDTLVQTIGAGTNDVDHRLALYAVSIATALAKSSGPTAWPDNRPAVERAVTALLDSFGDRRQVFVGAVTQDQWDAAALASARPSQEVTRFVQGRNYLVRLRDMLQQNGFTLSAAGDRALLAFLNRRAT